MSISVNFAEFQTMTNSKGEFKTWGDLKDGGYLRNLVHPQVLTAFLKQPINFTGSNISFEYKTLPLGDKWSATSTGDIPTLNRVMFNIDETKSRFAFKYKINRLGEKTAKDWSFFLGMQDSNIWKQINNANNAIVLDAVKKYCIATGQFKVLPNLGTMGKVEKDYFKDTENIAAVATSIMTTQTAVNLGLSADRIKIYTSPIASLNITTGLAAVNVSQGAFGAIKKGEINNLFGFDFDRSIYLGNKVQPFSTGTYDFSNITGVAYSLDSVGYFQHSPKTLMTPEDDEWFRRTFAWTPFAFMLPSQEHTSYVFVKTMPTKAEINAVRAELLQEQPSAYRVLPGGASNQISDLEYQTMQANASDFTKMQKPNVELPPTDPRTKSVDEGSKKAKKEKETNK